MPVRQLSVLRFWRQAVVVAAVAGVSACAAPTPKAGLKSQSKTSEYFAESEYGVKASPRISQAASKLRRGGGRDQVGKPYKVKGKWYYPKAYKSYSKRGKASWYGSAFHGRLTANGEIYDMTHLTAAHPTMPLPSYAKVTNLKNGYSVIVRVNDRGPFAPGRIIDLSKRAAQLLDYTGHGIAQVQVDYVGRAPLHGRDDSYLMASYRGGKGRSAPSSDGLPTGVMIAMNGRTPEAPVGATAAAFSTAVARTVPSIGGTGFPEFGPILPDRPSLDRVAGGGTADALLASYASQRVSKATRAFHAHALDDQAKAARIRASWQRAQLGKPTIGSKGAYVNAGTFGDRARAAALVIRLSSKARIELVSTGTGTSLSYTVIAYPNGRRAVDDVLTAAWAAGATDAFTVRD